MPRSPLVEEADVDAEIKRLILRSADGVRKFRSNNGDAGVAGSRNVPPVTFGPAFGRYLRMRCVDEGEVDAESRQLIIWPGMV